jgi:excinuclease ABC subunit C
MGHIRIISTKSPEFQEKIKTAPLLPGCYMYKDGRGQILYIGKAKVLRNRVKSYFSNYDRVEEKIRIMIGKAKRIDFFITDSEIEALILESVLIKKYKPKYNSMLVDDKSYAYVKFDKLRSTKPGEVIGMPSISVVRERLDETAEYFGPYPDSGAVKRLVRRLRRIYPFCTSDRKVSIPKDKSQPIQAVHPKACFHYQIELCSGPCFGKATVAEYERNLNSIKKFFKAEKSDLQSEFEREMHKASRQHNYEQAARFRNMLYDIKYVGSNLHMGADVDEVAVMQAKQERHAKALQELITKLEFPPEVMQNKSGFKIECYDISNIQGTSAVGSMVVFVDGKPRPDLYRRFRIKSKSTPDDFAMLQEVLTRRFNQYLKSKMEQSSAKKVEETQIYEYTDNEGFTTEIPAELKAKLKSWKPDESFSELPNLMIIDGGKGQLSSVYKILQQYNLAGYLPIVGLAKQEEEIFKVTDQFATANSWDELITQAGLNLPEEAKHDPFIKVRLPRRTEALYLVQRIRDEAHRFAITYHRKVRGKSMLETK